MTDLRYEKMTYELRGVLFEAHNQLRLGWPEEAYHRAVAQLLQDRGVPVQSEPRHPVVHRGCEVHIFECDLIPWDAIVLELKVLPFTTFAAAHYAQIIHYLKCWGKDLGLLVNFGKRRVEIERVIWDEPELTVDENLDSIQPTLADADRSCLAAIRDSLVVIAQQYGLGYPETMYRKMAAIELGHAGLHCESDVTIPAKFDNRVLARYSSDPLLIAGRFLLLVRSMLERPPFYDFARTKTYLNSLGLRLGLIANFGKKQLQIYGVSPD